MKCFEDNHCDGHLVIPSAHLEEIRAAINSIRTKPSRGKAPQIRDEINRHMRGCGWSTPIVLSRESGISISSVKDKTGLCIQTGGNMARMYADWLKLQRHFLEGNIMCGAMIVPSKNTAKLLGSNIVHATRLMRELTLFNKVINIPLIVFSFE